MDVPVVADAASPRCAGAATAPLSWAPMRMPSRSSPFYALRSVAFSADARPGSASKAKTVFAGVTSGTPRSHHAPPNDRSADEPVLAALLSRREAALAELARLDEQERLAREKIVREKRTTASARGKAQTTLGRAKKSEVALRKELDTIYSQQSELKGLRAKLKEIQSMRKSGAASPVLLQAAKAALCSLPIGDVLPPVSQACVRQSGAAASPGGVDRIAVPQRDDGDVAQAVGPHLDTPDETDTAVGAAVASGNSFTAPAASTLDEVAVTAADSNVSVARPLPAPPGVDVTLESLLKEVRQVAEALEPAGNGTAGDKGAAAAPAWDDEDADIELLRAYGRAFASLRHPSGSEALLDLKNALVYSWRHATGGVTPGRTIPSLQPSMLGPVEDLPWQVALIDDSNNEPSVTLTCVGSSTSSWWRAKRIFTLNGTSLQEELVIDNISENDESFKLGEESHDESVLGADGTASLPSWAKAPSQPPPKLRRLPAAPGGSDELAAPPSAGAYVVVVARGSWCFGQCWVST